jgi:tRNA-2-methylthio-N6-dimethylallyladenosine synthase
MNVNDSEVVAAILASHGYQLAVAQEDADIVLLNTCAIREHAEARVFGRLERLRELKRQRRQQAPERCG